MNNEFKKTEKYEIYIGLIDQDLYDELISAHDFKEILNKYCTNNEIPFSLVKQEGGYAHNKGFITETSLKITLIGMEYEKLIKMGQDLKRIVNTDTIMITREFIEINYQ